MAEIEETIDKQLERIIREIILEEERLIKEVFSDELENIQKQHAIDLTLDPDSAHPCLSEDRKEVRDGGRRRNISDNPQVQLSLFYPGRRGFFHQQVLLRSPGKRANMLGGWRGKSPSTGKAWICPSAQRVDPGLWVIILDTSKLKPILLWFCPCL
ncbi:E3 ubiquitin-protein ligase TRIM39-like [Xyrichtys novacula]|uniref:E3 ubiquitin-protein ligase TRIM39-like n=1 Tax=Xyrichtys novacula TaxID=13765 RepID=A0AAV1FXB0_XYRNO|nr:E3 ubiquitin-protein ligase TRIM39-like [Xyrichtys novacula]